MTEGFHSIPGGGIAIEGKQSVAFARALARRELLKAQIEQGPDGLKVKRGQTPYSIVKEVYGFRGSMKSVLEDMDEYIASEERLMKMNDVLFKALVIEVEKLCQWLTDRGELDQPHFEYNIEKNEHAGYITHEQRQAMSDIFYVTIVRQNAGYR